MLAIHCERVEEFYLQNHSEFSIALHVRRLDVDAMGKLKADVIGNEMRAEIFILDNSKCGAG